MKDHVVDLETAKKLKLPKGFESEFYWNGDARCLVKGMPSLTPASHILSFYSPIYPAPLLSEMLELLPQVKATKDYREESGEIVKKELLFNWVITGHCSDIEYINFPGYNKLDWGSYQGFNGIGAHSVNSATAAAKLYMWLVDNGYIKETK